VSVGWRAVELLSRSLDRDERDAVYGDLIESHASTGRALLEVGGLVLRRQAAAWLDWRPWFILGAVVVPVGFLLSVSSRSFATAAAHSFWLYVRTGDWAYFANPGWRSDVFAAAAHAAVSVAALVGWSWTTGFALARLSRRAAWSIGAFFVAILVFGTAGSMLVVHPAHNITAVVLVMLPFWRGLARGLAPGAPRPVPTIVAAAAIIVFTALVSKGLEGSLTFGYGLMRPLPGPDGVIGTLDDPRPFWWTSFVMIWPAVFMLRTRRERGKQHGGNGDNGVL
jgi:hypothetical protein